MGVSLRAAWKTPPKANIAHFVGYVGGFAVSIASIYRDGDVAGLYNVGTPRQQRKNGYAAALSNAAITDAIGAGAKKILLQTGYESEAHRLYSRLGFEIAFTATIWSKSKE